MAMTLSSRARYGVRAMFQLACHWGEGPISLRTVAEEQDLSLAYLEQLIIVMRRGGLVESVRGRNGGFVLANPPEDVSLADILRVFSPELFDVEYCNRFTGAEDICVHTTSCALRPVWWTLSGLVTKTLESISLMDVMCEESEVQRGLNIQLGITGPVGQRLFQISDNAQPE